MWAWEAECWWRLEDKKVKMSHCWLTWNFVGHACNCSKDLRRSWNHLLLYFNLRQKGVSRQSCFMWICEVVVLILICEERQDIGWSKTFLPWNFFLKVICPRKMSKAEEVISTPVSTTVSGKKALRNWQWLLGERHAPRPPGFMDRDFSQLPPFLLQRQPLRHLETRFCGLVGLECWYCGVVFCLARLSCLN